MPSSRRYWRNCKGCGPPGSGIIHGLPSSVPDRLSSSLPRNSGAFFTGWITSTCHFNWVPANTSACRPRMAMVSLPAAGISFSKKPRSSRSARFSASSARTWVTRRSCAARSTVMALPDVLRRDWMRSRSSRNFATSSRRSATSSFSPVSTPAICLPRSKAHKAMAPQKPSTIAAPAHCSGHGMALRTFILGALIVSRRLSSLKRMDEDAAERACPQQVLSCAHWCRTTGGASRRRRPHTCALHAACGSRRP